MSYASRRISLTVALALALTVFNASPVLADEVAAQVAAVRPDHLSIQPAADRVAGNSAASIAAAESLFHADLSGLLGLCDSVGEIVGAGPDVATVFAAFRNSPAHWSILTNPDWTAMGTGLATSSQGEAYVSVVFCAESGGGPAPEPPPPPPAPVQTQKVSPPAVKPVVESPTSKPAATFQRTLSAFEGRRLAIRALLDEHAQAMLPDWYVGLCRNVDRPRVLSDKSLDIGSCPKVE